MYSTKHSMEKWLNENISTTKPVIDYLSGLPHDNCGIERADSNYSQVKVLGEIPTKYISVVYNDAANALERLFQDAHLIRVWKSQNYISFSCWSSLDEETGVAYSLDGNTPEFSSSCVELVPIDNHTGWYFYRDA